MKLKAKLIHLLGGYTKEELHETAKDNFYLGNVYFISSINALTDEINGCDKQTWIDRIFYAINTNYEKFCSKNNIESAIKLYKEYTRK